MNLIILCIAALVLTIMGILFVKHMEQVEDHGGVTPPKHVPIGEADAYSAQELFDWAVYVTRHTGPGYLEQLNWRDSVQHNFLLTALRTVLNAESEEARIARFREIGRSFMLDLRVVDMPI